jgi:hypothetical protein
VSAFFLPVPPVDEQWVKRLWSKVGIQASDECWPWKEHLDKDGYAPFRIGSKRYKASRLVFYLKTGQDPGDLEACHKCNNPTCCNPEHIFAGTSSENRQQAVRERRGFVGELNGRAKITADDVLAIRASSQTNEKLAVKYGLHSSVISKIRRRDIWKHI